LIVNNNAVPNQHNNAVINDVAHATVSGLTQAVSGGNLQEVLSLFTQGNSMSNIAQNPVVGNIINNVVGQVSSKYGIDASQAQGIASSLIPQVLNQFSNKVHDPNDSSINASSLIGSLTGGKGAGGLDIGSLAGSLLGGGNNQQSGSGLLGGLLGKFLG
ncbi:MAG TPA: DUF937 domain-containing protein, partial [Chitinophagales bacterium]